MSCSECHGLGCPCCEEETSMVKCDYCEDGWLYFVDDTPVSKAIFNISPLSLCFKEQCEVCGGTGEVEDTFEYDDSDDRYEQYRERQWED